VPEKGIWTILNPDLKIGAIELFINKRFIFNSPELQRLCENLDSTYIYNFCMVVIFFYGSYDESSDFSL
jgi:hypothetical protein